jgi:hypothetical protein
MAPFAFSTKKEGKDSAISWEGDAEGFILAKFLEPRQTINAAHYVQTLHKLRRPLRDKRP